MKPRLSISMGDPGGIGPEIIVRALAERERRQAASYVIHGAGAPMLEAAERFGIDPYWWRVEPDAELREAASSQDVVLVDHPLEDVRRRPARAGGAASFRYVEEAIRDARAGHAHAICTAPISKEAWQLAGKRFPGHTELLQQRCQAKRCAVMFESPRLRVILATTHVPLMDVRNVLTIGRVHDAIDLGAEACRALGILKPRLGVCGLNPHAGEQGLMGDEESRLIEPAITLATEHGIDVRGPFPGDTIFNRALGGEFDLVVAMYHDQGLIPVKLLAWDSAVNVTLGLPFPRTSPDHGTAFDIAGRKPADIGSMGHAIDLAIRMTRPARVDIRPHG
ncbi:MAG: 4-hydroxythreonine-4-phosphate dehydrogenase PdxA [Phycisphaerales bacterium]|nr:4-hydroxythreonine-4-phosphate dehydrogenase PdxA [Phycisphaerales bacterium]